MPTRKPKTPNKGGKRGSVLLAGLFFTLLAGMLAASLIRVSSTSLRITNDNTRRLRALYVAVAGTEKAKEDLGYFYRDHNGMTQEDQETLYPPYVYGYEFRDDSPTEATAGSSGNPGYSIIPQGNISQREIEQGNFRGLIAVSQSYLVNCVAVDRHGTRARVTEDISMNAIPVAQFAVFYDKDLEILPGPDFQIEGRVHTNGDLYLGSHATLSIDSFVTSVGDIFGRRKDAPNDYMTDGTVRIRDDDGYYQGMDGLDSDDPTWAEDSQLRWLGRVRSGDHGVPTLRLPLDTGENPHDIIERSSEGDSELLKRSKFENKADLKIINGQGYDRNGNPVSLVYPNPSNPSQSKSIVSTRTFYNWREGKTIVATEINIGNLIESGIDIGDGVVYVSKDQPGGSQQSAVRLVNGARLPSDGLTVATDNPIYIKGDYNTINTVRSCVAGDAVNVLSNNWNDANSTYGLSNRTASNTTVKTVVMTGNTETTVGNYNGGLENVLRFLENWSGKTCSFRGSIIDLWYSETAVGRWIYGGNYYTAPNRDWRFDAMYLDPLNSPPGIPVVYAVERIQFAHEY